MADKSPKIVLSTRRLRIRELTRSDSILIDRHLNNKDVLKHLDGRKMSPKEHRKFVNWLLQQQRNFRHTFWAVERKKDSIFLGLCGLVTVDEPDSTVLGCIEIGWRFRMDIPRPGAAEEAARSCINYAIRSLKTRRVVSRTVQENEASWKLMQRIGMYRDERLDYLAAGEKLIVHVRRGEDGPVPAGANRPKLKR
ncbi:MAG: GNAT family N-acetyltransferase [Sphingomicrobium sp.]